MNRTREYPRGSVPYLIPNIILAQTSPFLASPVIPLNSLEGGGYQPKEMVNASQSPYCLKYLLRQEFIALL